MNLHSSYARSTTASPLSRLAKVYPGQELVDERTYSLEKQIDVGFAGISKPAPYLAWLALSPRFSEWMDNIARMGDCILLTPEKAFRNGEEMLLDETMISLLREAVAALADYGGSLQEDGSHTLNLLSPHVGPHYGVNLLLGWREGFSEPLLSTPKSVLDEFGRGSFRAKAAYQVLATRWDIRPEENGNPFNRQFYLYEKGKEIFYSADPTFNVAQAFCTHYPNRSEIVYRLKDGLEVRRTIFLLAQKPGLPEATEVQRVSILSPRPRQLRIVFTGVFGFANPDCQQVDVIYQTVIHESEVLADEEGHVIALSPHYYPVYFNRSPRFVCFLSAQGYAESFSNDASAFLGKGSIVHPEGALSLDNALKVKGASFFALAKTFTVGPEHPFESATLTGMVDAENVSGDPEGILRERLEALLRAFPSPASLDEQAQAQNRFLKDYSAYFQLHSGEEKTDAMVNANLPFQTLYQSFVSRAFAQTQKGYREIGFREIQDLYASLPYLIASGHAALAKELLGNWIKNVYRFGYANHNFFMKGKEPGMCSDDALWLFPAVLCYVENTNDTGILDECFPLADGGERSLAQTLEAILLYSTCISVGRHGLPLLDQADWNDCLRIDLDCLDGPAKEKAYQKQLAEHQQNFGVPFLSEGSESVMNGFLAVVAAQSALSLTKLVANPRLQELALAAEKRLSAALHSSAFIHGYYARVLINREHPQNGIRYVGAPGDGLSEVKSLQNGSLYLNSFSWSLLSGVASEEEIASMLILAKTYLKTPSGYRLCSEEDLTLTGAKQAATSHYFPGDRENGGVFKHATMMFTRSLLMAAKRPYEKSLRTALVDEAYFMLRLVYPYHCLTNPYVFKGNPRFCTQYNNPVTQENVGPILSGTATWLTLSLWEAAGFSYEKEGLRFSPILEKEQGDLAYILHEKDATYAVEIHKPAGVYAFQVTAVQVDGRVQNPNLLIPYFHDGKTHTIELTLNC